MLEFEPIWMEGGKVWMFKKSGCPAAGEQGCKMPHGSRPLMCKLFPFIPIPTIGPNDADNKVMLLLNLRCPNWELFGHNHDEAMKEYYNG